MSFVHNHPPYRPVCNERRMEDGTLRGACLIYDPDPEHDDRNDELDEEGRRDDAR